MIGFLNSRKTWNIKKILVSQSSATVEGYPVFRTMFLKNLFVRKYGLSLKVPCLSQ